MITTGSSMDERVSDVDRFKQIKRRVHQRLLEVLNLVEARGMTPEKLYGECTTHVNRLLDEQGTPLSGPERARLLREVMDEVFGLGPIEDFLRDDSITDILVNGARQVYVERNGRLELTDASFRDNDHVIQVIQRIAARVGRRIDESAPMLDARLSDGSRVNAIIPPLALCGPAISIRRFGKSPIDIEGLASRQAITEEMIVFFRACVRARLNILISGGTGTGKTTLLNALSKWIPDHERVITIEDAAELILQRDHVVRLETRPPNIEGRGEITQRELLRNSLRMRPDRIIIGEVRGAETLDMLQAMNTGHDGSMTTVHSNSTRDALTRIENMVSMAGINYPVRAIRQQIAAALDLVVHLDRLTGGRRRVVSICEVVGMEGDVMSMQDIYTFRQTGLAADGHARGCFEATGIRPLCLARLAAEGHDLPPSLFERRILAETRDGAGGNNAPHA